VPVRAHCTHKNASSKAGALCCGCESESAFRSPYRTPTSSSDRLAREYLTGTPCLAVSPLNQSAVGASLVGSRICPCASSNGRRIVRVFHCLRHRIVFRNMRQIGGACFAARLCEATNSRNG